ncbi:MAG: hypothetical protein ACI9WS_000979 [Paraglaciecola psychrophila]|jgi:hypothetical protein
MPVIFTLSQSTSSVLALRRPLAQIENAGSQWQNHQLAGISVHYIGNQHRTCALLALVLPSLTHYLIVELSAQQTYSIALNL